MSNYFGIGVAFCLALYSEIHF